MAKPLSCFMTPQPFCHFFSPPHVRPHSEFLVSPLALESKVLCHLRPNIVPPVPNRESHLIPFPDSAGGLRFPSLCPPNVAESNLIQMYRPFCDHHLDFHLSESTLRGPSRSVFRSPLFALVQCFWCPRWNPSISKGKKGLGCLPVPQGHQVALSPR